MSRVPVVLLAAMIALFPIGASAVGAGRTHDLAAREGDNTIFFTWDEDRERVTEATSSRRLRAKQPVELLTRLVDRRGQIVMRAVLKNISKDRRFRIDGRLVHMVMQDGDLIEELESNVFHTVLRPGDKIAARFDYILASGEYSARTDYQAE